MIFVYSVTYCKDMRIKREIKYTLERKGELQKDVEEAAGKVEAAAKVGLNKLDNSYSDLRSAYNKELIKQKMN